MHDYVTVFRYGFGWDMGQREDILEFMADGRLVRPSLLPRGLAASPREVLLRLKEAGDIVEEGRGRYRISGAATDMDTERWQEIAARFPHGILCLESAQLLHGLTDDMGDVHKVAVPSGASRHSGMPTVQVVSWRDPRMLTLGVEKRDFSGNAMKATDLWRTVADMFRPRNSQDIGKADAALARIVVEHGEEGVARVRDIASALGWSEAIAPSIRTSMELLRCAIRPR